MPFFGIVVYNIGLVMLSVGLVVPTVGFVIHILPNVGSDEANVCSYRGYIGQKVTNVGTYQTNGIVSDAAIIHAV